jgi:hypothetical protein
MKPNIFSLEGAFSSGLSILIRKNNERQTATLTAIKAERNIVQINQFII